MSGCKVQNSTAHGPDNQPHDFGRFGEDDKCGLCGEPNRRNNERWKAYRDRLKRSFS